jgi:hypothetical protein
MNQKSARNAKAHLGTFQESASARSTPMMLTINAKSCAIRKGSGYFEYRYPTTVNTSAHPRLPNEFSQQNLPNGDFTEPVEGKFKSLNTSAFSD